MMAAVGTSIIETNEVMAATKASKKKMVAAMLAPTYPIDASKAIKICGKNEKIMLTEESLSELGSVFGLIANIAGKVIRPAVKATAVSVIATSLPEVTISSLRLK